MDTTLKRLTAYHIWAMNRLFSYLEELPFIPPECLKLMQHIVNAESIWISRIAGVKPDVGVWDERPLAEGLEVHEKSIAMLQRITETSPDLARDISYLTTAGDAFINNMQDILIHVLNHGTYHRAQIAKLLRANDIEPINTDYILYVRGLRN